MVRSALPVYRLHFSDLFFRHNPLFGQGGMAGGADGRTPVNDQGAAFGTAVRELRSIHTLVLKHRQMPGLALDQVDQAFLLLETHQFLNLLGDRRHGEGLGHEGIETGGLGLLGQLLVKEAADEDVFGLGKKRNEFFLQNKAVVARHVVVDQEDNRFVAGGQDAESRFGVEKAGDGKLQLQPVA